METKMLSKKPTKNDFVPDEITEDILTRLPAKSLLRFKCVSKPWLSLISSPTFVKKHLNISSISPRLMCFYDDGVEHCSVESLISDPVSTEIIDIDYPDTNTYQFVSTIGSCNGLVCISTGMADDDNDYYFIWNPCTRIFKMLPPVDIEEMHDWDWASKTSEFVYNTGDDDYKVLRIFIEETRMEVSVYSLRSNSWKNCAFIDDGISPYSEFFYFAGKILISTGLDADVYGIENDDGIESDAYVLKVENIISFDLKDGVREIIEQPDYGEGVYVLFLKEVVGCFGVVCEKETHADLWVLKEYGVKGSWCKILYVSFCDDLPKEVNIYPLIMLSSGDILVQFEARLEVYNPKNNNRRVVDTSNFSDFLLTDVYVESLISPHQLD